MRYISGTIDSLPASLFHEMGKYRHRVFVEKLGWKLSGTDGLEYDQFDVNDTVYVIARNEADEISGMARLLSTDRPYLLNTVFPELLNGMPAPSSERIWEISRFSSIDFNCSDVERRQFRKGISVEILDAAMKYSAGYGVSHLVSVSPLSVERLLRRSNYTWRRLGPSMIINDEPVFACLMKNRFYSD